MKGLILAGGKGTRLRPLTINTPKPVVPVANSPFLLYQIDLMRSGGIDEVDGHSAVTFEIVANELLVNRDSGSFTH